MAENNLGATGTDPLQLPRADAPQPTRGSGPPMDPMVLDEELIRDEGMRLQAYEEEVLNPETKKIEKRGWSGGVGRHFTTKGISEADAKTWLEYRLRKTLCTLEAAEPDCYGKTEAEREKIRAQAMRDNPLDKVAREGPNGELFYGYGNDLKKDEIPFSLALKWLRDDWKDAENNIRRHFPGFEWENPVRKRAWVNASYNLGPGRLGKFPSMLKAARAGDHDEASRQMLVNASGDGPSNWVLQNKMRVIRLAYMVKYGDTLGDKDIPGELIPEPLKPHMAKMLEKEYKNHRQQRGLPPRKVVPSSNPSGSRGSPTDGFSFGALGAP